MSPEARRESGLGGNVVVVDVQDPASPRLCGAVPFPDARGPNGLELSGKVVFAAGGQTVQAVDVSNPERPRELANLRLPEVFTGGADDAHDLAYRDGHLYVTAQTTHAVVMLRVASDQIRRLAAPQTVGAKTSDKES